mgnify:CR=1 FL=1
MISLSEFKPQETFIEYNGDLVFSVKNDKLWLVYWCDSVEYDYFLAKETTQEELDLWTSNKIDCNTVLKTDKMFLIKTNWVYFEMLPIENYEQYLPEPGVYLSKD